LEQSQRWQHTLGLLAMMTTLAFSRRPSLAFSDFGSDDEEHIETNGAGYSTRMGELFDNEDETPAVSVPCLDTDEDGENDEAFIYDGADAHILRASYREQLRDVLDEDGEDTNDDDDELEEREVERSLVYDLDRPPIAIEDESLVSPLPSSCQSATLVRRLFRVAARLHLYGATLLLSALDHAHTFPLDHLRLPILTTRNALLPIKWCLRFNTLKTFSVLPTPIYLAFTFLHDARITSRLRGESKLSSISHVDFPRPV
jgi:hypothetical protein